jgi:hypothetical protein
MLQYISFLYLCILIFMSTCTMHIVLFINLVQNRMCVRYIEVFYLCGLIFERNINNLYRD